MEVLESIILEDNKEIEFNNISNIVDIPDNGCGIYLRSIGDNVLVIGVVKDSVDTSKVKIKTNDRIFKLSDLLAAIPVVGLVDDKFWDFDNCIVEMKQSVSNSGFEIWFNRIEEDSLKYLSIPQDTKVVSKSINYVTSRDLVIDTRMLEDKVVEYKIPLDIFNISVVKLNDKSVNKLMDHYNNLKVFLKDMKVNLSKDKDNVNILLSQV
mgnify:CR=1 FL=1